MTHQERMALIRQIEQARHTKLLVYVTGDRRGLETRIASDVFPFCLEHLSNMGKQEKIDLFIYSTGGMTMAGYALVNLIREFCDRFAVIIPFKALSAATLIALGANEVMMTKMAQLSPVDPSVLSPLGPQAPIPGQPGVGPQVPVNVEDVISYLDLARKELGIKEEEALAMAFDRLSQSVHPLTLGSVNRIREQIGFLARTLLSTHVKSKEKVSKIVETLTRGRFSHDYVIGRREAKDVLGLNVIDVDPMLEADIVALYQQYDRLLELSTPYYPETVLGARDVATGTFNRAVVESLDMTHVFQTQKEIRRTTIGPPLVPVPTEAYQEKIISEIWVRSDNI